MRSVADRLRAVSVASAMRRHVAERIAAALAYGDFDARTLARARGISEHEARRHFARQRQHGRVCSACHDRLLA